ncbi:hypothetical protein ABW19_dt0208899 [Dactylella cylindrospora]|nr:hypothetical protein ABW19_dt0208899 [Dactylella cylindrospora]
MAANSQTTQSPVPPSENSSKKLAKNGEPNSRVDKSPLPQSSTTTKRGGGSHGSIDSQFKMNPVTGTMSLSLPIYTSPARSALGPNLTLSYDSGSGNGPFGIGWQLSTSSISRKTSKGVPEYSDTDIFILSGHDDLVLEKIVFYNSQQSGGATVNGYRITRYRPRVENSRQIIECWQDISSPGNIFWRTISGENVTTIYGESDESRVFENSAGVRICSWLACRSYDSFGNAMEIRYKRENGQGVEQGIPSEANRGHETRTRARYIKSIKYGNRTPNRDLKNWKPKTEIDDSEWMFEVVFDYGEHNEDNPTPAEDREWLARTYPFSVCNTGFEVRWYRLCRRILMFHCFPQELERKYCLVSSTALKYLARNGMELLEEFTSKGHVPLGIDSYTTQTLPPVCFQYTTAKEPSTFALQSTTEAILHHFNYASKDVRWVDLFGDGAPGIVHTPRDGAWTYQRNQMLDPRRDSDFSPPKLLMLQPSGPSGTELYFEDINRDGNMDVVLVDPEGKPTGYHEYQTSSGWGNLNLFNGLPSFNLSDALVKRIDLNGDGFTDIIKQNVTGDILWHKNLAKAGFASALTLPYSEAKSHLYSNDQRVMTNFADMTGDGLADLVEIRSSAVTYWPNLGNGHFGPRVEMGNCPLFASHDTFDIRRLHLADINGSGTTDLVYLPEGGGLHIYYNQAGNSLGPQVEVTCFPPFESPSSVFTMDLLGSGTSCLCWVGPEPSRDQQNTLYYIDLTGGQKPFLLREYSTGLGSTTSVSYKPSTSFSLADELAGKPWTTKLPFPVQCVSEVVVRDDVARSSKTTRYAYRDGFYDGFEREFRGFGSVETWDEEYFAINTPVYFQRPTVRKKSWYFVGSPDFKIDGYGTQNVPENALASLEDQEDITDMNRALKGSLAREEVYGDDGSIRAGIPYTVMTHSYEVRRLQPKSKNGRAVYRVLPREAVSHHYERSPINPKISHEITLEVDDFGNVVKTLSISPGIETSKLSDAQDRERQKTTWASYTENQYTRYIHEELEGYFHQPLLARTTIHSIANLDAKIWQKLGLDAAKLVAFLNTVELVTSEATGSNRTQKALVKESRTYFYDQKITRRLDLGQAEAYSPVFQSYELAFTKDLLKKVYSDKSILKNRSLGELMEMGSYVQLESKDLWWAPSDRLIYSVDGEALSTARASFYSPDISVDPFKAITKTKLDNYHYLVESVIDPIGNITSFKNDYIQLQSYQTVDPNGNRTDSAYNCFGVVTGLARVGKSEQTNADSVEGFEPVISEQVMDDFLRNPSLELCRTLLGRMGSRTFSHPNYHNRAKKSGQLHPSFTVEIASDQYGNVRDAAAKITLQITYHDGLGKPLQTISLDTVESGDCRWLLSEQSIQAGEETVFRQYLPRFTKSHEFGFQLDRDSVKCTSAIDPLGRVVGNLHADNTWDKTIYSPWSQAEFDARYTINCSDPSQDGDIGPFFCRLPKDLYLPTWLQKTSSPEQASIVDKSQSYRTSPPIIHMDARGKVILEEKSPSLLRTISIRNGYDMAGNLSIRWDQLGRAVSKSTFDMLARQIHITTMDTGNKYNFMDCKGQVILACNSRGILMKQVYDKLRREIELWGLDTENSTKEVLLHRKDYGESQADATRLNLRGQIHSIQDQSGIRRYDEFDMNGNCLSESFQLALEYRAIQDLTEAQKFQDASYVTKRKYDALNRMTEMTNAQNECVSTAYHFNGLPQSVFLKIDGMEKAIIKNVSYQPNGSKRGIEFGNKTTVLYQYDPKTQRLLQKKIQRLSGQVLQDLNYTHDCLGRVILKTDKAQAIEYFRNQKVEPTWEYTFNPLGQLVQTIGRTRVNINGKNGSQLDPYSAHSSFPGKQGNGQELCQYSETYSYDDAGNMLTMRQEPLHDIGVSGWTRSFSYKHPSLNDSSFCNNSLSSCEVGGEQEIYTYGKTGCMTSMPGYSNLEWDWNDRLQCSSKQIVKGDKVPETTYYVYNSNGERVRKVTERSSPSTNRIGERRLHDTIKVMGVSFYTVFQGAIATVEKATSEVELQGHVIYLLESDLSSLISLPRFMPDQQLELDDFGQVIFYEEFSAFGSGTYTASRRDIEASRKYRFASYERDSETGLYFCQARYLAPWLGRWTSPDPLLYKDGLHLYAYVQNDPVNLHDPTGTMRRMVFERIDPEDMQTRTLDLDAQMKRFWEAQVHPIDTRPKGDQHHIFKSHYASLFRAVGFEPNNVILHVDQNINRSTFQMTHDVGWDSFWGPTINEAEAWINGDGAENDQIVDLQDTLENIPAKKAREREQVKLEMVAVYLKHRINGDQERLANCRRNIARQFAANMASTHLRIENVLENMGPWNSPDYIPMIEKDDFNNIREKNSNYYHSLTEDEQEGWRYQQSELIEEFCYYHMLTNEKSQN